MIELRNITKTFTTSADDGTLTTFDALKQVSLTVNDGDIYGIIGMSGAGKSTLVRCINLLERPTGGKVWLDGVELTALNDKDLREQRRHMGMIFQQFHLLMQKTALENVCFPLMISGVPKAQAKEKAKELYHDAKIRSGVTYEEFETSLASKNLYPLCGVKKKSNPVGHPKKETVRS